MKGKKAVVIEEVIGLGVGITVIAFIIVIGTVVLGNVGEAQASCATNRYYNASNGYCYNGTICTIGQFSIYNTTMRLCYNNTCPNVAGLSGTIYYNSTTGNCTNGTTVGDWGMPRNTTATVAKDIAGEAAESARYAENKLGSETGGFLTWIPIVIPAIIGIAVIGLFLATRRNKGY